MIMEELWHYTHFSMAYAAPMPRLVSASDARTKIQEKKRPPARAQSFTEHCEHVKQQDALIRLPRIIPLLNGITQTFSMTRANRPTPRIHWIGYRLTAPLTAKLRALPY